MNEKQLSGVRDRALADGVYSGLGCPSDSRGASPWRHTRSRHLQGRGERPLWSRRGRTLSPVVDVGGRALTARRQG